MKGKSLYLILGLLFSSCVFSAGVMGIKGESDEKDWIFILTPNGSAGSNKTVLEVVGEKWKGEKCYSDGDVKTIIQGSLKLNVNKFKCDNGGEIDWQYSPENNIYTAVVNDSSNKSVWSGFINASTTYK